MREKAATILPKLKKTGELPQIILVMSRDYAICEEIHALYKERISENGAEPEEVHLNGHETEAGVFHGELSTIPMFEINRLIWLRHADPVLKKIAANKTVLSYFLRDLTNIPESTRLLIQLDEPKVPKALEVLTKLAWSVEEEPLKEKDLPGYVKLRTGMMDFEIDDEAIDELTRRYAINPTQITAALDRLFAYCLHEKKINRADVEEVCFDIEGSVVFKIIDLIASRQIDPALKTLRSYKIEESGLLSSMLAKTFIEGMRYHKLKEAGVGLKEIHKRLDWNTGHSFIIRKNEERVNKLARYYPLAQLEKILASLPQLDQRLKENSSPLFQKTILTMFIASLQSRQR